MKQKKIGILGGMGPQASHEFLDMLINKSVMDYGARNGDDFPEIILNSIPVPDFISDRKNLIEARTILKERTILLNKFAVDTICITCNTAHILLKDLQSVSPAPFISIVSEVKKYIVKNKFKRIGLLSSKTTYKYNLYLDKAVIYPNNLIQNKIENIIRRVISEENKEIIQFDATQVLDKFIKESNLDAILLGCTEISLIIPNNINIPIINSLEILADAVLRFKT